MPYTYTVDAERGLVVSTVTGELSAAGLNELSMAQREDPCVIRSMRELLDFRGVDHVAVTATTIRHRAKDDIAHAESYPYQLAIVVASDLVYGFARMYELLTDEYFHVQVFRDYVEACAWLGV
jgi:hypothetical protein